MPRYINMVCGMRWRSWAFLKTRASVGRENFQLWLKRIGDGTERVYPDVKESAIKIPVELCVPDQKALIASVFTNITENFDDCTYLEDRVILCTKNDSFDIVNIAVLDLIPSPQKVFLSRGDRAHQFIPNRVSQLGERCRSFTPQAYTERTYTSHVAQESWSQVWPLERNKTEYFAPWWPHHRGCYSHRQ